MAFSLRGLMTIATGPGLTDGAVSSRLHFYQTTDAYATVSASGYFNSATSYLSKGDRIIVTGVMGGTPEGYDLIVTSATGAATVTTVAIKATALA